MEVTLPVYVQAIKKGGKPLFQCRPLFQTHPLTRHEHLRRALDQLGRHVKHLMDELARMGRHEALAAYHYFPPLRQRRLKMNLDLRDHLERCSFLMVEVEGLGRRLAFTPSVPQLWFEIQPQESLESRAQEVLTAHFLKQIKQDETVKRPAERVSLQGDAWVEDLQVVVRPRPERPDDDPRRQALWTTEQMDGWTELNHVGRCLDTLYPDDLDEATGRDEVVAELDAALKQRDRRPVLLVGRRLTGKTAVIHQVVRHRIESRRKPQTSKRNVWLLSPQRLVSGMSFVGQWENRLLAILREAKKHSHILYFNDLLGLYRAGISRDSSLSVADVLRTWIQDRQVRVLGEITPEALHAMSQRDRALVDEFQLIRLEETAERETMRISLSEMRKAELRHHCHFELEALPTIVSLQRRFVADACFPGKAARFLKQLAAKFQRQVISREHVCREFHDQTGLSLELLDDREPLERKAITDWMSDRIIGQEEALEATADIISLAKARLNAPDRPLATFVFLGPTGVGKTQCAKTIAEYLFGSSSRLLRFDMNQYTTSSAVAQLTGTFSNPEGQLTSRVRHQPYAVVLLDEIEKAHPDVFDLLLQIMGEGRLSDALGRTTDFTNTLVIMTSNLGVRDSQHQVGFAEDQRRQVFRRAAEQFFRPEFVNRIDRVIPFSRLSREHIGQVARRLLRDVLRREGVVRRRCVLDVDEAAMESVIDAGYHPHLGARALKRTIESRLAAPLAEELVSLSPEAPTLVRVTGGRHGLGVEVEELVEAPPTPLPALAERATLESLEQLEEMVDRWETQIRSQRPSTSLTAGHLTPEQLRYFAAEEQLIRVRETIERRRDHYERVPVRPDAAPQVRPHAMRRFHQQWHGRSDRGVLKEMLAANDIRDYFDEVTQRTEVTREQIETEFRELIGEAALLAAMAGAMRLEDGRPAGKHDAGSSAADPDQAVLLVRSLSPGTSPIVARMIIAWRRVFAEHFQLDMAAARGIQGASAGSALLHVSGPFARLLAAAEHGVHLHCRRDGSLEPIQCHLLDWQPSAELQQQASRIEADRNNDGDIPADTANPVLVACRAHVDGVQQQWRDARRAGRKTESPFPLGPIVRIYQEGGSIIDLRARQTLPAWPRPTELEQFRKLIVCSLPIAELPADDGAGADDDAGADAGSTGEAP